MRLGIVSDTHGHVDLTRPAVRMLDSLEVDAVLHCGDIGTAEVIEMFGPWPSHFVFGNCDFDRVALEAAIHRAGQTCHGRFGELTFEGIRLALLHSDDRRRFRETIESNTYDVVCYGHTHVASIEERGDTLLLNPGAIYRATPHSIAILEIPLKKATIIAL